MTIIKLNIDKLKEIAHSIRREKRDAEFLYWDRKATIPNEQESAEIERQKIRDKYAEVQVQIDAASTPEELKPFLS